MQPGPFELNVRLPSDGRFAATARELAVRAAKHAGRPNATADACAGRLEQVTRACLVRGGEAAGVPLVVRRGSGLIDVLVNGRTLSPDS